MTKTIYDKYDKTRIGGLPSVTFSGRIFVVTTESEAIRAVDYLMTQPLLGFDTETRPSFRHGESHKVALMQVSTPHTCFLFRLNHLGIPQCIISLLEDTTVTKVGLSLKDDFVMLQRRTKFKRGTFIDIQNEVKSIGIEDGSLQKIYANLFGQRISKRQQLSNWEADILTEAQKQYAATDAWACIQIYEEIQRLKQTRDFSLIKSEDDTISNINNPT